MPIKDHLKYYWLEKYLEDEVRPSFVKNHFLTTEQFFAIIFWKSKRPAKLIRNSLLDGDVEQLTAQIFKAPSKEEKLRILLNQKGFSLAMASGVLTILYPEDFTVYDIRVRSEIGYSDISSHKKRVEKYFGEYIPKVRSVDPYLSLRNCDRALWGRSWYKDLQDFIGSVNNSGMNKSEKDIQVNYDSQI